VQARLLFRREVERPSKSRYGRGCGRWMEEEMKSGEGMGLGELMYVVLES
jgi:hypothetical protein